MKKYVYMDNFRGFSKTLIPLDRATFLVGENSTGKSSFLSLVHLLSSSNFWFTADLSSIGVHRLGGFSDIVSMTSDIRNYFTIGLLVTRKKGGGEFAMTRECRFALMTFRNEDGMPRISRYVQFVREKMLKILFLAKSTRFKYVDFPLAPTTDDEAVDLLYKTFDEDMTDRKGFITLPVDIPPKSPLPLVLAISQSSEQCKVGEIALRTDIPAIADMTWLAPIRTKPHRTYDGFKTDFTPEGDHTPHVIRKTLGSRDKARRFKSLLKLFGDSSGMFTHVDARTFGKDPAAPFEVRVEIAGGLLNISNVGYGVSQVLPVVVEMLTRPKGHWFAIQQPEVHLHPKAQAALGDLIHFLVQEQDHHYIIETHSDYLIDRFRLRVKESGGPSGCSVIFFARESSGNTAHVLPIDMTGKYPKDQPSEFKRFFIDEELRLLDI